MKITSTLNFETPLRLNLDSQSIFFKSPPPPTGLYRVKAGVYQLVTNLCDTISSFVRASFMLLIIRITVEMHITFANTYESIVLILSINNVRWAQAYMYDYMLLETNLSERLLHWDSSSNINSKHAL